MKEKIFTIPISESFEPKCGCPLCRIKNSLEQKYIEYIMGAAMMEPDIREQTNKMGFCNIHFDMLLKAKNRLSLALMLKSRLSFLKKNNNLLKNEKNKRPNCYVCFKIKNSFDLIIDNIFHLYSNSAEFRELFCNQQSFCFEHYKLLGQGCEKKLKGANKKQFLVNLNSVFNNYIDGLYADVSEFCDSYDYRNAGKPISSERVKKSIEKSISFFTQRLLGDE